MIYRVNNGIIEMCFILLRCTVCTVCIIDIIEIQKKNDFYIVSFGLHNTKLIIITTTAFLFVHCPFSFFFIILLISNGHINSIHFKISIELFFLRHEVTS